PVEAGPVECLGLTFESDEARRAHFLAALRAKLAAPGLREAAGFPRGADATILHLSDPPYYTACPNPFWADVVGASSAAPPARPRAPFVADVEVGKNDRIYNAHSYHTKVPHRAIQRYLLHYTEPGDVVLDPFCGAGMTGVACAELDEPRRALLCDLSPAAANIAFNYVARKERALVAAALASAVQSLRDRFAWMYRTRHTGWPSADRRLRDPSAPNPGSSSDRGDIEFTVWSDVFACPHCGRELVYWHAAASSATAGLRDQFPCPSCQVTLDKRRLERAWETALDPATGQPRRAAKRRPVLIQYRHAGKTFHKLPDDEDLALARATEEAAIPEWHPTAPLHDGDKTSDPKSVGITHAHHFFTRRNLAVLAALWATATRERPAVRPALQFLFTSTMPWATRMNRLLVSNFFKKRGGVIGQTLSGTLYVSSVSIETNPLYRLALRERSAAFTASSDRVFVSTQSATDLSALPDDSVDYVFTDPPFGHNLVYSDLNFLWEGWLGLRADTTAEAIISGAQGKSLRAYEALMSRAFAECLRVLKPGRWITVEFHNSKNAVWRAIQQALGSAGFVVASVSVLSKTHGTFNQVTAAGAVSKDLAISAYKPRAVVTAALTGASPEAAWTFVREHLRALPVLAPEGPRAIVIERTPQLLLDRMIAFHVQRGARVPLSAAEFLQGLARRFPARDGMHFLDEQAAVYDHARASSSPQRVIIHDEATAIAWVRQQLQDAPRRFQELQPLFMGALQAWARHEATIELRLLLEQCFLRYDGRGPAPSQLHRYLSAEVAELRGLDPDDPRLVAAARDRWYVPDPAQRADLERLRERALLREFAEYQASGRRTLKVFRAEAVRAGFKACWQARAYQEIVAVADKLPAAALADDEALFMYSDNARTRLGDG
ncbi:MAG: hypothetical protein KC636_27485, partial [Myxococcales bacterium]|nr:hypothetical protein [Myxococcales bacterium]